MTGPSQTSVPVSVVIPTMGRPALLRRCLESLGACDPPPAEVVVVDQSPDLLSRQAVPATGGPPVRIVPCAGTGRGRGVNAGLRAAREEVVLVVDDDMTVRADWAGVGAARVARAPRSVTTGRVLPVGDARLVPSTITEERPRRYGRHAHPGVLYAGNMGVRVQLALAIGGFDEQIVPAAEDCDFAYRWLRSGLEIDYEPALTVWHHDWRTDAELRALYRGYGRGQGLFYAKHLRRHDPWILRFVLPDLAASFKVRAGRRLSGRAPAPAAEMLLELPAGLIAGRRALAGVSRRA